MKNNNKQEKSRPSRNRKEQKIRSRAPEQSGRTKEANWFSS